MRKVSKKDWEEFTCPKASFPLLETILDGQSPNLLFGWLALLYKKYRLGDWQNTIPDPDSIPDKTYLLWHNEEYCLFHKNHEKFGEHIIECAHPYAENVFVFFDFFSLKPTFDALDKGGAQQVPYVPTYYAWPHDRYDYSMGSHMWE